MKGKIGDTIKALLIFIVIVFSIYLIYNFLENIELIIGVVLISFGIMSIIWTLLARYNLTPRSSLRMFANNFLACSLSVLFFTIILTIGRFTDINGIIYIQYFFIFTTYFFFILVSYYLYTLGKEFGFKAESFEIKKYIKSKKKK